MYLSELVIVNYRSCRSLHVKLECDYPNVLIGINDCGKSTLLQAIGLLLMAKPKFNFVSEDKIKNDISNTPLLASDFGKLIKDCNLPTIPYSGHECIVVGKFVIEAMDVKEESAEGLSPHLRWAIDSSQENSLWLCRIFGGENKTITTFLLTHDSVEAPALYKEKDTQLNKRKNDLNLSPEEIVNYNNSGRPKNIELIRAIYRRYTLELQWAEYQPEKDKGFWVEYRYLDWNISLEQLTQFANDAVKEKITSHISQASAYAREKAVEAQQVINEELMRLAGSLRTDFQNIKSIQANINFQVNSEITDLLVDKVNSDGPVHLDSQGDGVKRQIWFALMKLTALSSLESGMSDTKFIWCFDEPETHLYPKAQREFFELIKGVSKTNVQSIISTHSTIFIDRAKLSNINKVDLLGGYTITGRCSTVDDIYHSLLIRNSDFLFYDKFLVVEGDTEQELIPNLYELHFGNSLAADNVQLINLGGKEKRVQNQRILQSILEGFRKDTSSQIVYIFDCDACLEFTQAELDKLECFFVGKQDLEDSIDSNVWLSFINAITSERLDIKIEDIDAIKANIDYAKKSPMKVQANQKFYARLVSLVWQRAAIMNMPELQNSLPTKGKSSGKMLASHVSDLSQIDHNIQAAFTRLRA